MPADAVPTQDTPARTVSRELRLARVAAYAAFLLTGFTYTSWAARLPTLKADLGITDAQLAVALVGLEAGAIAGLQLGALVVTRLGSRRTLLVALPVLAASLVPISQAPTLLLFTLALAVSAIANSVVDVAINDQGVGVQHRYGRSLLSGMHAMHSLGGVLGGALAAAAAYAGLGTAGHLAIVGAVVVLTALAVNRALLPPDALHGEDAAEKARSVPLFSNWTARLLALGTIAFLVTFAEGSALNWSAVLLADNRDATAAVAAAGLTVHQIALTVGRLVGDPLITRAGPVRVFVTGALLAGAGYAAGIHLGTTGAAITGLALLGFGLAPLLPISISAAGTIAGLPVPVAVARVSTLAYLGSFTGPALIGYLSDHRDLPTALLLPALAVAATATAARAVRGPGRRSRRAEALSA